MPFLSPLLHKFYTASELQLSYKRLMEVSEARSCHYHHLITSGNLSSFLHNSHRLLSPHICHHLPLGNMFRFTLCIGSHSSTMSPVMSARKGHFAPTSEGLCDIVWTVEANLEAGQLLYVTGDLTGLGGWQPEMAVLMCPTEDERLWKAEVKIPSGVNFKYNYFRMDEGQTSCDIIWRPGPEFSLLVPSNVKQDRKVLVKDSWMKPDTERSPAHFWGSWIEEIQLPAKPLISSHAMDRHEIAKDLETEFKKPTQLQKDLKVQNSLFSDNEGTVCARYDGADSGLLDRDQPIEEPWLQSSVLFLISENETKVDLAGKTDTVEDGMVKLSVDNQHSWGKDGSLPLEENNQILKDDTVSTVILINSSICTMQRIAVLEDEKLVELLLEPVKSDVQCDSVYLGVVTKLVPHMGGAFANIGSSRPSFMDIKQNREPFIFPPFRRRTKKGKVNCSGIEALEERQAILENQHESHDVQITEDFVEFVSQDESAPIVFDDNEEHENDDEFDILEEKLHINGSAVDCEDVDPNSEHLLNGKEQHLEGATDSSLLVETEMSNASVIHHSQNLVDAKHMLVNESKWAQVRKGTKIVVQVVKEGLGTKGATLTAYPKLRSRFWILLTRCDRIGVSKKIAGIERTRLKVIAKTLQPLGFGLTVRTVAAGHSLEELQKDLEGLLFTWKAIMEHAKSAALAADEGIEGAVPNILHRAMGQTLSVVQDYFNEKVKKMVVDSPRTYHEVTNYLQDIAPDLCDRVELYDKRHPLFREFKIEEEINNILSKRVPLTNGGSLVIEQTEALVSIDVNGGHVMFGHGTSQEKAVLDVNLAAAKQIARELRLRDIGGIIVVDFIDMTDESNKRLVYEETKQAVERDRSIVKVSELSKHGLMEITRKRVRPSVTFMISEPCTCCHATGRVEALETSFSKIEQEICQLLASRDQEADPENPKTWPRFILRVDHHMCNYLTSGKKTRLAILSSSLRVWILLKVARGFTRGEFEVKPFNDDEESQSQHKTAISVLRQAEARSSDSQRKVTLVTIKKGKTGKK